MGKIIESKVTRSIWAAPRGSGCNLQRTEEARGVSEERETGRAEKRETWGRLGEWETGERG
jgi:hypothetical protein